MNFIKHNFGSYSGYLTHLRARFSAAIGRYATFRKMDWSRVERFVFVCKGNVCRSPYAEAKARSLGFQAISFGLDTAGGVPANTAALSNAHARGVDLADHRSKLFNPDQLRSTDLVLAFEPGHIDQMLAQGAVNASQFSLVGLWNDDSVRPVIADPYGKSDVYFQVCFEHIDRNVAELVRLAAGSRS